MPVSFKICISLWELIKSYIITERLGSISILKRKSSLNKKHLTTLLTVMVSCIIISNLIILVTRDDSELGVIFSNWTSNTAALAAVAMAIITTLTAFRLHKTIKYNNKKNEGHGQIELKAARGDFYSLLSLTIGLALWLMAEFIWTYYQLVVGTANPFPSVADAFWLAGYPFIFYFVLRMNKAVAKDGVYDREALLLISVSTGLALTYTFTLAFGIQALVPGVQDRLGYIISLSYPILDTIALVPSLVLIGLLRKRKEQSAIASVWLLMAGSIVVVTLADIAFSYTQRFGQSTEEEWLTNILYSTSYIFMAGALYWYYSLLTIFRKQSRSKSTQAL